MAPEHLGQLGAGELDQLFPGAITHISMSEAGSGAVVGARQNNGGSPNGW